MKIENIVTNFELSVRLKELRLFEKHPGLFAWIKHPEYQEPSLLRLPYFHFAYCDVDDSGRKYYPAYTVAELGEILPPEVWYGKLLQADGEGVLHNAGWGVWYDHESGVVASFDAMTEADTRAKMLIYLIENNLLKL